jgi:dTDP-4-amino-4,6-dideoxygalactose transaminase
MKSKIYLSSPHMSGNELKYIHEAFDQNWIAPVGPNLDAFEKELGSATGVKYVAALSSGTAAIHLALILLNVGPGDYVIGPTFTFSATINPIVYLGATPVLIDSEADTWNMDPDLLEKAILGLKEGMQDQGRTGTLGLNNYNESSQPPDRSIVSPKAIIVTHLYGMPANMKEITKIARKYNIPVIEDAAEALGSEYMGNHVGCNGKFGILSFNGNKIITTSGGGALLSDDQSLINRARFLASQARDPAPHYQHSNVGYNYRMSNIVAGIGRGQLHVIDERVKQRRSINLWYRDLFKDVPGVTFHSEPSKDFYSNFWLTCILIDPEKSGTNREKVRLALQSDNIEARPLWKPMHLQPVFAEVPRYINGTSAALFKNGLCLPSGSNLTEGELHRIKEVLKKEFNLL